jgi:TolB-like protein
LAPTELVTAYSEAGRHTNAEAEVAYILKIKPDATVRGLAKMALYKDPKERERVLTALRKAGLPENPPLPLPDKPSIAVLPFTNMSGDPEQEYFADGIAEDIITGLSRNRGVFVIARNSTFTYKDKSVGVKQVSQELGVRYVLEGSVRKAASRVRITAQLVDATTGNQVWAERYDRQLEDVFAVQDEITQNIVATIGPELASAEMQRARRKDPNSLDAWEYTMRAWWHFARLTREDIEEARRLALRAIELDPGAAPGFSILAITRVTDAVYGWSESPRQSISEAYEAAQKAVALDDRDANAHRALGNVNLIQGRFEDAVSRLETAIDLDPNNAGAHGILGGALALAGRTDEVAEQIDMAMRLSPRDPLRYWWLAHRSGADFMEERYDEAAEWARKALQVNPDFPTGHRQLAAIYGRMGRIDEARAALDQYLRLVPGQTVETVRKQLPFKRLEDMERWLDGLRKAGLPE